VVIRRMRKLQVIIDFLERPIGSNIVIFGLSLLAAVILFQFGSSAAEVTGQEGTFLGFTFKAGGALAGFIIIYVLSSNRLDKLRKSYEQDPLGVLQMVTLSASICSTTTTKPEAGEDGSK
jgi:hypothetical protein